MTKHNCCIKHFHLKVNFLLERVRSDATLRGQLKTTYENRDDFARALGVSATNLANWCPRTYDLNKHKQADKPKKHFARNVARVFGFAPSDRNDDDEIWLDWWKKSWSSFTSTESDRQSGGSATEFERCYLAALQSGTLVFQEPLLPARSTDTAAKSLSVPPVAIAGGPARANSPTSATADIVKGPPQAPQCNAGALAAIEVFTGQVGHGCADVGVDISCGVQPICGIPVKIRKGEMMWDCGGAQINRETSKGYSARCEATDAVKLSWNGGNTFNPRWLVEAYGDSIGNMSVAPGFGQVIGLVPGLAITVSFWVWRLDIEEAEGAHTSALVAALDDQLTLDVDFSDLSDVKRRIWAKLAAEAIQSNGDLIMLSRHTVTFVARPSEES